MDLTRQPEGVVTTRPGKWFQLRDSRPIRQDTGRLFLILQINHVDDYETNGQDNHDQLFERIKEHCRKHCAWLHKETELEEYSLSCLSSHAYGHWEEFKTAREH